MIKKVIVVVVMALGALILWFVYPRYKLYQFLEKNDTIDGSFLELCFEAELHFSWYYERFYEYPESSEDTVFRESLFENFGHLPDIYNFDVFLCKDTITINDSIESVVKLYLRGPNHNKMHTGQIINSIDYKNQIITSVNIPFYKFLFAKGDILIGVLIEYNPCNQPFSNFSYKENLNIHDTIVGDSFRRAVLFPYREKYGVTPEYIRHFYDDVAVICYEANLYSDTLILSQICEPFNGEYDTSPMAALLNNPLYTWAKDIGLHQFYFSIAVRPSFFEKKTNNF